MTRKKRAQTGLEPGDSRHGTASGYSNYTCRCAACKAAWASYEPRKRAMVRWRTRTGVINGSRGARTETAPASTEPDAR